MSANETIRELELQLQELSEVLGAEEVREILDLFLEDSAPRLEMLSRAVAATDTSAAQREAHSLKGAAGNLGAMSLWSVCEGLERQIKHGDWPAANQDVLVLRSQLGAVYDHFGAVRPAA